MSQSSVLSDVPANGPAGSLHDAYPHTVLGDKVAKTDIPFGRVCVYKTASGSPFADLPTATGEITGGTALGISMWDPVKEQTTIPGGTSGKYLAGDPIPLIRKGMVTMDCETACVEGAAVFVRFTTAGGGADLGQVRNDADTAKAVALPGAVFRNTLSGAGKAIVELNLP